MPSITLSAKDRDFTNIAIKVAMRTRLPLASHRTDSGRIVGYSETIPATCNSSSDADGQLAE
jgi:hypothetical protein